MTPACRWEVVAVSAPQSAPADPPVQADPKAGQSSRPFRADIDGLRAVAVSLVILFHADVPGFAGGFVGVDVFFVISGFLITQGLLSEHARTGGIQIVNFWLKRARRLLPAAGLMIASVLVAQLILRSPLVWDTSISEAFAAATYWSNIQVSGISGGYFGARVESRPLLHTWSLSVEEQFYIVWPLLFIGLSSQRVRGSRFAIVAAASVIWCIALTTAGDANAYFSSASRAWEFLIGAMVATWFPQIRARAAQLPNLSAPAGGIGLAMIVASAMWLGRGQPFPWPGALLPVAGTVAFLIAQLNSAHTVGRALAAAPVQWIGRVSYSWYLWHWPFLVLGREVLGSHSLVPSLALVAASLAVAHLSYRFVETPYRHRRSNTRSGEVVGALVVPIALTLAVIGGAAGYRALTFSDPLVASIEEAADGWPAHLGGCYSLDAPSFEANCVFGQADGVTTVLVIGDSHAAHWMPTFDSIGQSNNLRVVALQLGSCPVLAPSLATDGRSCDALRAEVDNALLSMEPDLVVSSTTEVYVDRESTAEVDLWRNGHRDFAIELADLDIGFLVLHDIGRWDTDPLDCLLESDSLDRGADLCGLDRAEIERHRAPVAIAESEGLAEAGHGLVFDPMSVICDPVDCLPIAPNGDIVMQDSHHVTRSYAESVAPSFEPVVLEALSQVAG